MKKMLPAQLCTKERKRKEAGIEWKWLYDMAVCKCGDYCWQLT
jgi:hypothetical protein